MPVIGQSDAMFRMELSFGLTVAFSCVEQRELLDSATLSPDRPVACSPCDPAPISTSSLNVAVSLLAWFASRSSSSTPTSASASSIIPSCLCHLLCLLLVVLVLRRLAWRCCQGSRLLMIFLPSCLAVLFLLVQCCYWDSR